MKILKMPPYSFPEQISSSHLTNDLYEAYKKNGINVEIYVPTPSRGVDVETRNKYKKILYEELYDGHVIIHRFPMIAEGKKTIIRAARYILINFIQYMKGCRAKNVDMIMSSSTPPTQGILCALVKKRLKVPFVYSLQDVFPDSMVNAGLTKEGSFIWKIGKKIEAFTYRNADKIIVINNDFKQLVIERGVPEDKVEVIYNWVDENEVFSIERKDNVLIDRFGLNPDKFYITYCGNIGHSQNFEMLIQAAELLKEDKDIEFVLIGEGAYKQELEKIIESNQINNIKVFPFQPYEDISHVFSLGDVGLIISKPNIGVSSVPSKTWSIMSASRPILASFDLDSELCKIITSKECGLTADAGDVYAFVESVKKLKDDKVQCNRYGQNGRSFIEQNLTKNSCTQKYVDVYRSVLRK